MRWLMPCLLVALAGCGDAEEEELTYVDDWDPGKSDTTTPVRKAKKKGSIKIEVDFVGYQRFEKETVALLGNYFASIGYALTVEQSDVLAAVDDLECGSGSKQIQGYYRDHFDHRGQRGWWYLLVADSLYSGLGGWGALGGDVFAISDKTRGCRPGDRDPIRGSPRCRYHAQAHIILHELGHNLGLKHAGLEPERSAGKHDGRTCATASDHPRDILPLVAYSPLCAKNLTLAVKPLL
jgi:hypothetical protein